MATKYAGLVAMSHPLARVVQWNFLEGQLGPLDVLEGKGEGATIYKEGCEKSEWAGKTSLEGK